MNGGRVIKSCVTCKFHDLAGCFEPCKTCIVGNLITQNNWQPISTPVETPPVIENDHSTIANRVSALEAEVKRLASRKVCWHCKGVGAYAGEFFERVKCETCNGTGYIESEEK